MNVLAVQGQMVKVVVLLWSSKINWNAVPFPHAVFLLLKFLLTRLSLYQSMYCLILSWMNCFSEWYWLCVNRVRVIWIHLKKKSSNLSFLLVFPKETLLLFFQYWVFPSLRSLHLWMSSWWHLDLSWLEKLTWGLLKLFSRWEIYCTLHLHK